MFTSAFYMTGGYAALMVAVWPFGVPLFYIGLMWTDRKTLQQRRLKGQYNSRVDQVIGSL